MSLAIHKNLNSNTLRERITHLEKPGTAAKLIGKVEKKSHRTFITMSWFLFSPVLK